jgi:hypothetical protein
MQTNVLHYITLNNMKKKDTKMKFQKAMAVPALTYGSEIQTVTIQEVLIDCFPFAIILVPGTSRKKILLSMRNEVNKRIQFGTL